MGSQMAESAAADMALLDVRGLMDSVREEVTQLMLEGVQKTASFCASLCAERIVAARREMQRRWREERRELERLYGLQTATAGAGFASPGSCPTPTPRKPFMDLPPRSVPSMPGSRPQDPSPMRSTSSRGAFAESTSQYDSTFIDAYDAVQTLEERTQLATRAMDLLDEALQAAADVSGTSSAGSCAGGATQELQLPAHLEDAFGGATETRPSRPPPHPPNARVLMSPQPSPGAAPSAPGQGTPSRPQLPRASLALGAGPRQWSGSFGPPSPLRSGVSGTSASTRSRDPTPTRQPSPASPKPVLIPESTAASSRIQEPDPRHAYGHGIPGTAVKRERSAGSTATALSSLRGAELHGA